MVTGAYRELFVAIAGAAGALTGLLFVALSVAPRPRMAEHPNVIRQIRAAPDRAGPSSPGAEYSPTGGGGAPRVSGVRNRVLMFRKASLGAARPRGTGGPPGGAGDQQGR